MKTNAAMKPGFQISQKPSVKLSSIFASEYRLYLPSKEDLLQRLIEWTVREKDIR